MRMRRIHAKEAMRLTNGNNNARTNFIYRCLLFIMGYR